MEDGIHLARKLLEDTLRGWGPSTTQDASDGARLLEAPSPLVLMMVIIPSWRWRQRRKACIAVWAILTRLISPGALARLALPTVLTRLVACHSPRI